MEIKPIINPTLFGQLKEEIENGKWIEDREKLCIANENGWTIAHEQAKKRWVTEDKEILKLADKLGWTVAHEQTKKGWMTEDKEILMLADKKGWTVAHEQVKRGWTTEDKEILKLATQKGWTVAHQQARKGWITTDPEILALNYKNGVIVWVTINSEVLTFTYKYGITVYEEILSYWDKIAQNSKRKFLLDKNFNSLLSVIVKGNELVKEENLENRYKFLFEYIDERARELLKQKIKQRLDNIVKKLRDEN